VRTFASLIHPDDVATVAAAVSEGVERRQASRSNTGFATGRHAALGAREGPGRLRRGWRAALPRWGHLRRHGRAARRRGCVRPRKRPRRPTPPSLTSWPPSATRSARP
jgi:hypothetical protein